MARIDRQAGVLGLLATVIVIAAASFGLFDAIERRSIDLRFAHGRIQRDPMSPGIVHVDIDDGAIDTVGRWPWPRDRLADAIDELRRAGARVIVLDLMFDDPSPADRAHHDERLAEAIASVPTVLGVTTTDAWEFGREWEGTAGIGALYRLLDHICADIAADATLIADAVGLVDERRRRFLARPAAFRQIAVWRYLTNRVNSDDPPADIEALIAELSPDARRGVYAQEIALVRSAWSRYHAWLRLREHLPGDLTDRLTRDRAPIDVLSAVAASVGFVNADEDLGGMIRFTRPMRETPVGRALPLGMAAALLYEGRNVHEVEITPNEIIIADRSFPLHHGMLWIPWPTSETSPAWEGLLRQIEIDPPTHGRISAGALVELAELRRIRDRNELEFHALVREFARTVYDVDLPHDLPPPNSVIEEVRSDVDFFLADTIDHADVDFDDDDESAQREAATLRLIRALDREVQRAREVITRLEDTLALQVEDRLVFVGATYTGTVTDVFPTAVGTRTPGVVVHAAIADMVLRHRVLRFAPEWSTLALAGLLGVLCTLLAVRLGSIVSGIVVGLVLLTFIMVAGVFVFDRALLALPLVAPTTAGFAAWVSATSFSAALYQRDRSRITRQFKARVSPQLVDRLIGRPESLSVSGDEREVTILFCDLVGFTPLAERLGGAATVSVLNRTLGALTEIITAHRGYVNKFLGDGLMAFWSAFEPDAEQGRLACESLIACRRTLESMPDGLQLCAGVATGRVIVGDCGAPPHLNDYTVIGDAVNLAARLESANRMFGSTILIDERTRAALGDDPPARLRRLGRIIVHGQSRPTLLYELLVDDDVVDDEEIRMTHEAVDAFIDGDLSRAKTLFESIIERCGDHPFARQYLEGIDHGRRTDDGALRMSGK